MIETLVKGLRYWKPCCNNLRIYLQFIDFNVPLYCICLSRMIEVLVSTTCKSDCISCIVYVLSVSLMIESWWLKLLLQTYHLQISLYCSIGHHCTQCHVVHVPSRNGTSNLSVPALFLPIQWCDDMMWHCMIGKYDENMQYYSILNECGSTSTCQPCFFLKFLSKMVTVCLVFPPLYQAL